MNSMKEFWVLFRNLNEFGQDLLATRFAVFAMDLQQVLDKFPAAYRVIEISDNPAAGRIASARKTAQAADVPVDLRQAMIDLKLSEIIKIVLTPNHRMTEYSISDLIDDDELTDEG